MNGQFQGYLSTTVIMLDKVSPVNLAIAIRSRSAAPVIIGRPGVTSGSGGGVDRQAGDGIRRGVRGAAPLGSAGTLGTAKSALAPFTPQTTAPWAGVGNTTRSVSSL